MNRVLESHVRYGTGGSADAGEGAGRREGVPGGERLVPGTPRADLIIAAFEDCELFPGRRDDE